MVGKRKTNSAGTPLLRINYIVPDATPYSIYLNPADTLVTA